MDINIRIKKLREKLGLSQQELALKVGYQDKSAISKVERGERDITQSMIVKYAEALGTTPAYLMGWEEEQTKNDAVADIILRMKRDEVFLEAVSIIYGYDEDKLMGLLALIK